MGGCETDADLLLRQSFLKVLTLTRGEEAFAVFAAASIEKVAESAENRLEGVVEATEPSSTDDRDGLDSRGILENCPVAGSQYVGADCDSDSRYEGYLPKGSGDNGMGESDAISDGLPNEGGKGGGYMDGSKSRLRILVSVERALGEADREGGANDFGAPVDTPLTASRGGDGERSTGRCDCEFGDCDDLLAIDE